MSTTLPSLLLLSLTLGMSACSQLSHPTQSVAHDEPVSPEASSGESTAASTTAEMADSRHEHPMETEQGTSDPETHEHAHTALEIPAGEPIPTVDLIVSEDAMQGWNLELLVTNFQFAPERVNQTSQFNEGHAHLYINGEKVGRLYSPWFHLATLPPGEHILMVTLNANGHEELQSNGATIMDTASIVVPE
jgi:hypothetical protein